MTTAKQPNATATDAGEDEPRWEVQHNHRLEIVETVEPYAGHAWKRGVAHVYRGGVMNGTRYSVDAEANAELIVRAVRNHGPLLAALRGLLAEPYGCSLCDSGKPRNEAKGHQPDCPYEAAREAIAKATGAAR
jgi:hypothetical protein